MKSNKKLISLFIPFLSITFYIISHKKSPRTFDQVTSHTTNTNKACMKSRLTSQNFKISCNEWKSGHPIQMSIWSVTRWKLKRFYWFGNASNLVFFKTVDHFCVVIAATEVLVVREVTFFSAPLTKWLINFPHIDNRQNKVNCHVF